MHHILAFSESVASGTDLDIAAVSDGIIAIANDHFLPQQDYDILFAQASGADLNRAKIVSPSNRQITLPYIRPINVNLLQVTDPNVADYRSNPFKIRGLEELAIQSTNAGAGTVVETYLIGLGFQSIPTPPGNNFTLRGTSTTAAVAQTWTQIVMTWDNSLPQGRYAIVGAEFIATNQKAGRLVLENTVPRPGGLGQPTVAARTHEMFYKGGLGVWGYFSSTRMPIIEVLNNGTDNAHTVNLDIVRVA